MKKIFAALTVLGVAASLCACSVNTYSTSTTTTTTTDANGNTTTTTTTTTNKYPEGSCGAAAEDGEAHKVSVSLENATGAEMTGFYICNTGETEWSNLFDEGEVLADGDTDTDYITITYTSDSLVYDIGIKDADGQMHEFDEVDISDFDADGFTITFGHEDDAYVWSVDSSYIMQ